MQRVALTFFVSFAIAACGGDGGDEVAGSEGQLKGSVGEATGDVPLTAET